MSTLLLLGLLLVTATPPEPCAPGLSVAVESILEGARERNRKYEPPSAEALETTLKLARALESDTAKGKLTPETLELAKSSVFDLVPTHLGTASAVAVVERAGHRGGGGVYVIKCGARGPWVVQVPHSFYDEGTLVVGLAVAAKEAAGVLFVNTIHRYEGAPPPRRGDDESDGAGSRADLAHQEAAHFQRFTEAFVTSAETTVVQLHGFASLAGLPDAQVVLSDGSTAAPAHVTALQGRLATALKGKSHVLVYPKDVRKLGATTNVQGTLVRKKGARFVHVEMSRALRDRLISDATARADFADAVVCPPSP